MDQLYRWRRSGMRLVLLGVFLLAALLATYSEAPWYVRYRADDIVRALGGWLPSTEWLWPLAAALALAVLTSSTVHRRWPQPARRALLAIGIFVGLVGLVDRTLARPRVTLLVLVVVVAVGLLAAWVLVVPRRFAPPIPEEELGRLSDHRTRLEAADARVKLQNDLRTTALQAIAGLAVLAGAVLGFQQLTEDRRQAADTRELTLQGQASERFVRAIDQLGSNRAEAQLGGIYGLEQIAQQAPNNRLAVTEVLVAYLHRHVPRSAKPSPTAGLIQELRIRAPDAQAALTVLGRRHVGDDDPSLDLQSLDLRRADLNNANLYSALLRLANLSGNYLAGADLRRADLRSASLVGANLDHADLRDADLRDADLHGANLNGVVLASTDLRGARLTKADLSFADFSGAILAGANLTGANLRSANLSYADLRGATLRRADLQDSTANQDTKWPDGFDWRSAGVQQERTMP